MNTPNDRFSHPTSESGQAAVLVAFLLFLVFLAFAALAIDGAMTYLVRRDLQNVADSSTLAACRVIANNDMSVNGNVLDTAFAAAENAVSAHLGTYEPFVGDTPPSTNAGAGVDLVKGIEVYTSSVRVAVQRRVPTVLTQFLGRGDSFMLARANCNSRLGGGLMPIAVRRYDGLSGALIDYVARQGAPAYSSDSITVTWSPGRYGPYDVPVPCGNPDAPSCAGGVNYTASDSAVAGVPDANSGPAVEILGQGALPNTGKNSYSNFVMLDIRDIASGSPEYYNGATGNPNTDKDIAQQYIYSGYPLSPDYPGYPNYFLPGEQMAILDGASASFEAHSVVDAGYQIGDALAVIVYDGNVWDTPDFAVNLTPKSGNGINTTVRPTDTTTAISYTVSIAKSGSADWSTSLNFDLGFKLSEASPTSGGSCGSGIQMRVKDNTTGVDTDLMPSLFIYPYTVNNVIGDSFASGTTVWTGTLYVWTTDPTTTVPSCVSGLNLVAVNSQGLDKGTSSHFGFGTLSSPYYTVRSGTSPSTGPGIITIQQGQSVKPTNNLITRGFISSGSLNCSSSDVNVSANVYTSNGSGPLSWTSFFPTGNQTTKVAIKSGGDSNLPSNYSLDALTNASIGSYILRFTVAPNGTGNCSNATLGSRSIDIPLSIEAPPGGSSTPTNFVVFQGYAVFRVSGFTPNASNPNTVWGYAISPLYRDLSQVTYGLRPRLVPWE